MLTRILFWKRGRIKFYRENPEAREIMDSIAKDELLNLVKLVVGFPFIVPALICAAVYYPLAGLAVAADWLYGRATELGQWWLPKTLRFTDTRQKWKQVREITQVGVILKKNKG